MLNYSGRLFSSFSLHLPRILVYECAPPTGISLLFVVTSQLAHHTGCPPMAIDINVTLTTDQWIGYNIYNYLDNICNVRTQPLCVGINKSVLLRFSFNNG